MLEFRMGSERCFEAIQVRFNLLEATQVRAPQFVLEFVLSYVIVHGCALLLFGGSGVVEICSGPVISG